MQPPASLHALGDPLYEVFYGLNEQPFSISTDPKFLFPSASHQTAYQELLQGLQRREGLLLMTGETGTGKTTLCRALLESLGPRTFSAIVLNPYMTGTELLKLILRDFGLVSRDEVRRGALATADTARMLDLLEGFLLSIRSVNSYAVIVVDEAQSLAPAVLDQVRLLTAIERSGERLVQVMLCGQPALLDTLKKDSLYALTERITRRVHLAPLAPEEIDAYIRHRLSVAGGTERVQFDRDATLLIADLSRGLPRRVNLLCDRSLQQGRIENAHAITAAMVKRAARQLAGAKLDVMNTVLDSLTTATDDQSAADRTMGDGTRPSAEAVAPVDAGSEAAAPPAEAPADEAAPAAPEDETADAEPPVQSVWPQPDAREADEAVPPERIAAQAAERELLGLSMAPSSTNSRRRPLLIGAGIVVLVAGGYLLYAGNTLAADPNVPAGPAPPPVDTGAPAELPAVPAEGADVPAVPSAARPRTAPVTPSTPAQTSPTPPAQAAPQPASPAPAGPPGTPTEPPPDAATPPPPSGA